MVGTDDVYAYAEKYNMKNSTWNELLGKREKYEWGESLKMARQRFKNKEVSPDAVDLLEKMMVVDHANRITPKEALEHEYFD